MATPQYYRASVRAEDEIEMTATQTTAAPVKEAAQHTETVLEELNRCFPFTAPRGAG